MVLQWQLRALQVLQWQLLTLLVLLKQLAAKPLVVAPPRLSMEWERHRLPAVVAAAGEEVSGPQLAMLPVLFVGQPVVAQL